GQGRWRRWAPLGAMALLGAGALAISDPFARLAGGVAVGVGAAWGGRGRLPDRPRAPLLGSLLAAWPVPGWGGHGPAEGLRRGVALCILALLATVFGLCILAVASLALVESSLGLLGGLSARLRADMRPPMAYLSRRPLRTGLASGSFAIVLVVVTVVAVFQA